MPYILAQDEVTVRLYSSRSKTSPQRRQAKSSTPSTINSSSSSSIKRSRSSTVKSSTRSTVSSSARSTSKQESDIERESPASSVPSLLSIEVFPIPEPIRPVFCCTTVEPNARGQAHTLGSTTAILQRGRLRIFLEYTTEYSLSNAVPVVEDLTWPLRAEYVVKVLQYRQEDTAKSPSTPPPWKKPKVTLTTRRKGKIIAKQAVQEVKWVQANPGRYFLEVKHVKHQRRSDHAFEEILITEEMGGIPACFEKVEEITMEAECSVHSNMKWVCEFWAKSE